MLNHTTVQIESPAKDAPQWIVAIVREMTREEAKRFGERMQETVQQHLDAQTLCPVLREPDTGLPRSE